jgi:hypothetical protein
VIKYPRVQTMNKGKIKEYYIVPLANIAFKEIFFHIKDFIRKMR